MLFLIILIPLIINIFYLISQIIYNDTINKYFLHRDFLKAASFISSEIGRKVDVIQLEGFRFAEKIKKEGIKWKPKNMPF